MYGRGQEGPCVLGARDGVSAEQRIPLTPHQETLSVDGGGALTVG